MCIVAIFRIFVAGTTVITGKKDVYSRDVKQDFSHVRPVSRPDPTRERSHQAHDHTRHRPL